MSFTTCPPSDNSSPRRCISYSAEEATATLANTHRLTYRKTDMQTDCQQSQTDRRSGKRTDSQERISTGTTTKKKTKKGSQKHVGSEASRALNNGRGIPSSTTPNALHSVTPNTEGRRQIRRPFRWRRPNLSRFTQLGFQVLDKVDVSIFPALLARQLSSRPLVFFLATLA